MASITATHAKYDIDAKVQLAYTVRRPRLTTPPRKLALVAHPLGRLGGSKEDHVVMTVARLLAENGYIVVTFDTRGCGESSGSASFKGTTEAEDYNTMLLKVLLPLCEPPPTPISIELLLCGYSYGSLQAIATPPPIIFNIKIHTRYILVSYPLSVLWALTLGSGGKCQKDVEQAVQGKNPVLAIYGDADEFSGAGKYDAWSTALSVSGGNSFQAVKVGGADHFWRGTTHVLASSIETWLIATGIAEVM